MIRKKKKERRGLRKKKGRGGGGGVKIHPFHLPWIRACSGYSSFDIFHLAFFVIHIVNIFDYRDEVTGSCCCKFKFVLGSLVKIDSRLEIWMVLLLEGCVPEFKISDQSKQFR